MDKAGEIITVKESKIHIEKNDVNENYIYKNESILKPIQSKYIYHSIFTTIDNFEFVKLNNQNHLLGLGTYSKIILSRNKLNSKFYAIKIISKCDFEEPILIRIINSGELLRGLNHSSIIKIYSILEDAEFVYIVMDYIQNGTLLGYINSRNFSFSGIPNEKIIFQLVSALAYLHEKNLLHGNILPENILIDEDFNIRLSGFSICTETQLSNQKYLEYFKGSIDYIPPGVINHVN